MSKIIDLPAFPASLGIDETALIGSLITVTLQGVEKISGLLLEFNGPLTKLTMAESDDGAIRTLNLQAFNFLQFSQPCAEDILMTRSGRSTRVDFIDGTDWQGVISCHIVDQFGLHLLVEEATKHYRFFFPINRVSGYRIGPLLGEFMVTEATVSEEQVRQGLSAQKDAQAASAGKSPRIGEILVGQGSLSEEELAQSLAKKLGLGYVDLRDQTPDESAIELIPESLAREYKVIPVKHEGSMLQIALKDPSANEAQNVISFLTGLTPEIVLASEDDINWALDKYYSLDKNLAVIEAEEEQNILQTEEALAAEAKRLGTDRPIVRLVNLILAQAIHRGASDIHIRPNEHEVELLLRIDGNLVKIRDLSKSFLTGIVARIKIIGRMDVAKRFVPQDGQTRVLEEGMVVDMRISVLPTVDGESVVIRLLNTKYGPMKFEQLGFSDVEKRTLLAQLHKLHGLILVTGPTGSGKSTTLYAALDQLLSRNLSIITIEEPVEFHIPGIDQVQVDERTGLTFAKVLRNILRHDPDAIMVGEIRDEETAKIAVQSSLTGHLVLSTLHTNSAVGAVGRLFDMGVDAYLLAPTLLCILAQRLLKKNCAHCLVEEQISPIIREQMGLKAEETVFRGTGCDHCDNRGLKGRVGVYELLGVTEAVRTLIYEQGDESKIVAAAERQGMVSLLDNARRLVRLGTIPVSEAYTIATDF